MSEVRSALRQFVREGTGSADLTRSLRRMSEEGKRKDMRAEQLLVVLKGIWGSLPEVRYASRGEPHGTMLQQVISLCIEQYYER